jgi:HAE1 family hydrophobic/amphiphilic exporter-1
MNLSKIAVNKPVTFLILFILILILGIYASMNLPIDLYPDINLPVLFVFTEYSGTGPEEIEKSITRPLESAFSNVSNIDKLNSTSSEGVSQIILTFKWGTDIAEASNEVRDKIEYIKQYLPDDAETPMIFKFDPSMMPIMYMAVRGKRAPEELRKIAEDILQPRLEQVEGIAMASVSGGRERAIRVEVLQNRLQAYNLTLTQIASMLNIQNRQISAGSITEGNKNYLIRTTGEYEDIEEIKNTVVAYKSGSSTEGYQQGLTNIDPTKVVLLRDVANVYDGLKKEEEASYVNGETAVQLIIQKQSGANSVKAADNLKYKLFREKDSSIKNLFKGLGFKFKEKYRPGALINELPKDIQVEIIYDTTKMIKKSLSDVTGTLLSGAFLAIIILFFFLRSFKAVTIIGLSIPISVIITILLMYFFGFTLNVMTMAGLVLGIGMLVDNSIVILDNIYRYREKGAKLTTAAILGTQEMVMAITASTFTTICVFAPILMFKSQLGIYGELFNGLAFTVVLSLTSSLFVAIFLVPILASKYLPIDSRLETNYTGYYKKFDDKMDVILTELDAKYKQALQFVLRNRKKTILFIAGLFLVSLILVAIPGFQLMPKSDEDHVRLSIEMPAGTKLELTKNICTQFEEIAKTEIKGYKSILTRVGEKSFFGFLGAAQSHKGSLLIIIDDKAKNKDNSTKIQEKLRKHFMEFPSVIFSFSEGGGGMFGSSSNPIDILVKTDNLNLAFKTSNKIKELLKTFPEITEPSIDLKEGLPQIEIKINRQKAYSLGLNINSIGNEIRANIDGITASKYREGGSEYDILVILDPKDRDQLPDLDNIFVLNAAGQRIPLSSIASIPPDSVGPVNIKRENQKRTIHITAGLKPGAKLNVVENNIRRLIKQEIPQEEDLVIDFSGEFADLMEYGFKLILILLIAILLVYGIMAAQFESLLDPFIIIFTIPLSLIGVIWINLITFDQLSILNLVGIIVLAGVVVNNGIVLVDYTNLLIKRGLSIFDACVEAGRHRLRPILMTTLTTVLGLLPMAFTKVEGSNLSQAIGKTVFGGLTISTIFTLFLIPVIYSIFNEFSQKQKEKHIIKRQQQLEIRKEKLSQRALKLKKETK